MEIRTVSDGAIPHGEKFALAVWRIASATGLCPHPQKRGTEGRDVNSGVVAFLYRI
jgi:hypothetical protein